MGRARGLSLQDLGGWGWPFAFLRISGRAALSAVPAEEGEGEGPLCGQSGGGGGESGKVSLGDGRVKGPLPDGLLTLWCPASPIPASTLGAGKIVLLCLSTPRPHPCPRSPGRSGENKLPRLGSQAAGARGAAISGLQSQVWKLRPLAVTGGRKRLRGSSEGGGAGRHLPNPSPPGPRSEAASLASWSPCPCHIRGCGFTVVGHQRAGDLRLVTGCSQSPYPYVTLGRFLGWASVSPSVKWSRQNLAPFWNS